jgi:C-6 monooxygenase
MTCLAVRKGKHMKPFEGFFSMIDYAANGPDSQPDIAAAFALIQEDWVASYPGFVCARFFANTDGSSVRAIVQWASESDFKEFERLSDTAGRTAALKSTYERLSTGGVRQTFRAVGEVAPITSPDIAGDHR